MKSREFFGTFRFKDVDITLYNNSDEVIYKNGYTTFPKVNPLIKKEIDDAICYYKKYWKYKGEPVKCKIVTTPAWNVCVIDLITKKKEFKHID